MTTDHHVAKDIVVGSVGDERFAGNGLDLEQACHDQELPAADHVTKGLVIGHFIREVHAFHTHGMGDRCMHSFPSLHLR